MQKEKLSFEQAWKRLDRKFLAKEPLKLSTSCIKKTNNNKPDVKVAFWYYPEYGLLITDIVEIKYTPGHSKGWLFLAEIGDNGEINIIETTFWTN